MSENKETWGSQIGVILAVAGSAIGIGNFLRFPSQAAQYGGGAFMVAYFISFLLMGLPICWVEWTIGRYGGSKGVNACPGILGALTQKRWGKYIGVIGMVMPIIIYAFYIYVEAWCLGYAVNFFKGSIDFTSAAQTHAFFNNFVGAQANGGALVWGWKGLLPYILICFGLNLYLIYRGLSKGIELFCTYAMPALMLIAFVLLIRVLTLGTPDTTHPERTVTNGLGFMWNPHKVYVEAQDPITQAWQRQEEIVDPQSIQRAQLEAKKNPQLRVHTVSMWAQLLNPQLWLAAAGQCFFALSVGVGIIMTYASYLTRKDDVLLSGLSAVSASEFCQIVLGGLMTLTAAVAFLGVSGVSGMGTFGLGFNVLPLVFSQMSLGGPIGSLFFFLLFLAAVSSSISLLQPPIAFFEEALGLNRHRSVWLLTSINAVFVSFAVYFSKDLAAMESMAFWAGEFLIFLLGSIQVVLFGWVFGVKRGFKEAHQGSILRIPKVYRFIIKYICPLFSLGVLGSWLATNVFGFSLDGSPASISGPIRDLFYEPQFVPWAVVSLIGALAVFFTLTIARAPKYKT